MSVMMNELFFFSQLEVKHSLKSGLLGPGYSNL